MAEWIIPCNPRHYDIFGAFDALEMIDWRQTVKNIETGDNVYIYVGTPVQAVAFQCKVMETMIPPEKADHSDAGFNLDGVEEDNALNMRLKLIRKIPAGAITFEKMRRAGMKGCMQGQRRVPEELKELFDSAK